MQKSLGNLEKLYISRSGENLYCPTGSSNPVSYTHLTLPTSDLVEISAVAVSLKKKKTEKLIFLTILLYINKHEENVYKRQLEDGIFFFFKQKTAYEISACLVGSEMCIRDSY